MEKMAFEWSEEKKRSEVIIGTDFLFEKSFSDCIKLLGKRFVIITDSFVAPLFGEKLRIHLEDAKLDVSLIVFEAGEKNKSRQTKDSIEDQMVKLGLGRETCIIALGGGVVTDLSGYIAATYLRGIPYISIPTTLLAMVDASIGGKTGINTPFGKNLIGAFYPATFTFIDVSCLETLTQKEFLNGFSEVLKMGLISSPLLFEILGKGKNTPNFLPKIISLACSEKIRVIKEDPKEKGLRRILNFGHTIAHGLEKLMDYAINHGEAVAFGMIIETTLSHKLGFLNGNDYEKILTLLYTYRSHFSFDEIPPFEKWLEVLKRDKKNQGFLPRFVLLKGVGKVVPFKGEYCSEVSLDILEEVLCNYTLPKVVFQAL